MTLRLTEHPLLGAVSADTLSSGALRPEGGTEERPNYLTLRRLTLKKYGLTPDDYQARWYAQGGCCAICHREETAMREGVPKMLAVDHDPATGLVRGLLCYRCNVGLGLFAENCDSLRAAISYLESHLAQAALDRVCERVPSIQVAVRGEVR